MEDSCYSVHVFNRLLYMIMLGNRQKENPGESFFILDLRSQQAAIGNRATGGGFESYPFVNVEFGCKLFVCPL